MNTKTMALTTLLCLAVLALVPTPARAFDATPQVCYARGGADWTCYGDDSAWNEENRYYCKPWGGDPNAFYVFVGTGYPLPEPCKGVSLP
jgi:hypothetical protein